MSFKKTLLAAASAVTALTLASPAVHASFINTQVPTNAYITFGGLDWAWAFPLPASDGIDLSTQSAFGWRLPTAAELANSPDATDFVFAGANVPFGGTDFVSGATFQATNANLKGDAACATPYFSNSFKHCDWQDGKGQIYGPWAGMPNAFGFADQLVVRNSDIPEPAALGLVAIGLLAAGAARRRRG